MRSLPLTVIVFSRLTKGSSVISNQLEAGSIMVRAIKSICKPSLPLRVYGPIKAFPRGAGYEFSWKVPVLMISSLIYLASLAGLYYLPDSGTHTFPVHRSIQHLFETCMSRVLQIMVVPQ